MDAIHVIAVFDIGKTNKKLLLFDEDYKIVFEKSSHLNETVDEDGDTCEDIDALTRWILDTFDEAMALPQFKIKAINCSTYGASFVFVDAKGKPVAPLYNYLKPYPESLKSKFYTQYGGEKTFAQRTASPVLGSLNSGMQIYRLIHEQPRVFEETKACLHLPQYVAALFTGSMHSELTSIGCHTNLWDFPTSRYHPWVAAEGLSSKLPPTIDTAETAEISHKSNVLYSGIGLHDSSAALIPYLSTVTEPFVLLSTGTWCITLSPFNSSPLTDEELSLDCLCYLSYQGKPVKASRLFSGHDHELAVHALGIHFNKPDDYYVQVSSDTKLKKDIIDTDDGFDADRLDVFDSYESAYVALIQSLVRKQVESTKLVMQKGVKKLFVDGGFSKNLFFMDLLSQSFPDVEVYAAAVVQASALGAALAIHDAWNKKPLPQDLLHLQLH